MKTEIAFDAIVGSEGAPWEVTTSAAGPAGRLPLTAEMLLERPSADIFGLAQSLRAQGKTAEADQVQARFRQAWARADVTLTASRF